MSRPVSVAGTLFRVIAPPAMLLVGVGGFWALAESRERPQPRQVDAPTLLVETVPVKEMSEAVSLETDGLVVPHRTINLSAEVAGRVVEKSDDCRAGRTVAAGELLLRIDPATYQLEIDRLTSQRDQTKASLDELSVQIANSEASIRVAAETVTLNREELERLTSAERRGAITQQQRDDARRQELSSRTNLVTLQNEKRLLEAQRTRLVEGVKLVETQLAQAKLDLKRTEVRAPINGVIVSADLEMDSYLRAGDPILTIEDTSAVEVSTNLEMRAIAWLRANQPAGTATQLGPYDIPQVPVTVTYEVLDNVYSWQGTLLRYDGIGVDERTRTIPCRVMIQNPQAVSLRSGSPNLPVASPTALMRGMFVKVMLHSKPAMPLLSIPEAAVRPGNVVWAVREGKLAEFPLPAARVMHGTVVVASQVTKLSIDDQVIISPLPSAREGMEVRVQPTTPVEPIVETVEPATPLTAGDAAARAGGERR